MLTHKMYTVIKLLVIKLLVVQKRTGWTLEVALSTELFYYSRCSKWRPFAFTHVMHARRCTIHWSMAWSKSCLNCWTPCLQTLQWCV